jgi:hypothetical protein
VSGTVRGVGQVGSPLRYGALVSGPVGVSRGCQPAPPSRKQLQVPLASSSRSQVTVSAVSTASCLTWGRPALAARVCPSRSVQAAPTSLTALPPGGVIRASRSVSLSQPFRVLRRLARKDPSVGGASIADNPGRDAPVTKSSRGKSSQQALRRRAVALPPAWRGGLGSLACRRRAVALPPAWRGGFGPLACRRSGLVRIDHHGS